MSPSSVKQMTYFDHNATTPLLPEAAEAWLQAAREFPANPSSPHRLGARAEHAMNQARQTLATRLSCDPLDLVWTSGATEANNMVLHHFAGTLAPPAEVWLSAVEHPCTLQAARHYFPARHRLVPVNHQGVVDLDWLREAFQKRPPGLLAIMAANNETGVLQPWPEIRNLCREYDVPYFCDAAQWVGKLPAAGLGDCDFVSGCAHKFGGPKGVGFLKCAGACRPLLLGGPQESGRRAGTENVPAIIAMVAALQYRERLLTDGQEQRRLRWRERFEGELLGLGGVEILGQGVPRLWNTVSALLPAADCRHRWVVKLDKMGFAVSTGSACASGKEEASHVLKAMRYSASEADRVLRFSGGWETTKADWQALADAVRKAVGLQDLAR